MFLANVTLVAEIDELTPVEHIIFDHFIGTLHFIKKYEILPQEIKK